MERGGTGQKLLDRLLVGLLSPVAKEWDKLTKEGRVVRHAAPAAPIIHLPGLLHAALQVKVTVTVLVGGHAEAEVGRALAEHRSDGPVAELSAPLPLLGAVDRRRDAAAVQQDRLRPGRRRRRRRPSRRRPPRRRGRGRGRGRAAPLGVGRRLPHDVGPPRVAVVPRDAVVGVVRVGVGGRAVHLERPLEKLGL